MQAQPELYIVLPGKKTVGAASFVACRQIIYC